MTRSPHSGPSASDSASPPAPPSCGCDAQPGLRRKPGPGGQVADSSYRLVGERKHAELLTSDAWMTRCGLTLRRCLRQDTCCAYLCQQVNRPRTIHDRVTAPPRPQHTVPCPGRGKSNQPFRSAVKPRAPGRGGAGPAAARPGRHACVTVEARQVARVAAARGMACWVVLRWTMSRALRDLRAMALRRVPRAFFQYADHGSYTQSTLRANRAYPGRGQVPPARRD